MGHRLNVWIQRLLAPIGVMTVLILRRVGYGIAKTVAVALAVGAVLMIIATVADPGPKAKELVAKLKNGSSSR